MTRHADLRRVVVLGVDLGTGAGKVCAVDRKGRVAGTCTAPYATLTPKFGWAEQSPEAWMPALADATARLLEETSIRGRDVAGVVLSSAAHIAVLLDRHGRPTRKAVLWSDQRSQREVDEIEAAAGAEVCARTGNRVSTTWTLPRGNGLGASFCPRTTSPIGSPAAWRRIRRRPFPPCSTTPWNIAGPPPFAGFSRGTAISSRH